MTDPQATGDNPLKAAARAVEELIRANAQRLVEDCRKRLLARPEVRGLVQSLRVHDSDDWLRQAVLLFRMCLQGCGGAAVEWHDEVGELNFAAGLSITDANSLLGILRDSILELVWEAANRARHPNEAVPDMVRAVLRAYDRALGAQAEAYVRESRRHLSEINRRLEFRQNLFERDLALAELVQKKFIPQGFESDHFRAAVRYVPTTGVGGDHAGIFPVSPTRLYVTISDVTGHGIASALVAEVVNSQLRPLLLRQVDDMFEYNVEPVAVVRELNKLVYTEFQPLGILLSFFVALIDSEAGTLAYSGAGHPPPIVQCCQAHNMIELHSQNIILGATEDCVFSEGQDIISVHRGDRVILYTDGIIEANDGKGKMLGIQGLRNIVQTHYESSTVHLADEILTSARQIAGSNETDDMSLILLDILTGPKPNREER